jgi:hypothetical protein
LISLTALPTSIVTVPDFGFGMSHAGPRTFPRRPSLPIMSGVAMIESISSMRSPLPSCSTRSSPPTWSAPASRASICLVTAGDDGDRTVLPMPCGSDTAPRIIWSALRGSTPSRKAQSTVGS